MYGVEIKNYVANDEVLINYFGGIYGTNTRMPIYINYPSFIIFNSGRHWVSVLINKHKRGEYFDSFGLPPPRRIHLFLNTVCTSWEYNATRVQSKDSPYCGHYCLLYLRHRLQNFDPLDFINIFKPLSDIEKDIMLCNLFKNKYSLSKIQKTEDVKKRMLLFRSTFEKRVHWK